MLTRKYGINSIFGPTIQGEGPLAGEVCKFIRFSGCNMWDGRPSTKAESNCPYCDTDFFHHTMMEPDDIYEALTTLPGDCEWIWVSGGEPLLQLDQFLVNFLHVRGHKIAVETNGTIPLDDSMQIDLLTMSPKLPVSGTKMDEVDVLKVLYPHPNPLITPESYDQIKAQYRYLQPIESTLSDITEQNMTAAINYVYANPQWRLGVQIHKLIGVL